MNAQKMIPSAPSRIARDGPLRCSGRERARADFHFGDSRCQTDGFGSTMPWTSTVTSAGSAIRAGPPGPRRSASRIEDIDQAARRFLSSQLEENLLQTGGPRRAPAPLVHRSRCADAALLPDAHAIAHPRRPLAGVRRHSAPIATAPLIAQPRLAY